VTVKGNQRAVRLTTVSLVEGGFIFGTGIQCLWKNISGTSVFQKNVILTLFGNQMWPIWLGDLNVRI
jgi:hypothetical protein